MAVRKVGLLNSLLCEYEYTFKGDKSSLSITYKTQLKPTYDEDFKLCVANATKRIKNKVFLLLRDSNVFSSKFILDVNTAYSKMKVGKKSFATIETFVKRVDGNDDEGSVMTLSRLIGAIVSDELSSCGFTVEPKEKWKA